MLYDRCNCAPPRVDRDQLLGLFRDFFEPYRFLVEASSLRVRAPLTSDGRPDLAALPAFANKTFLQLSILPQKAERSFFFRLREPQEDGQPVEPTLRLLRHLGYIHSPEYGFTLTEEEEGEDVTGPLWVHIAPTGLCPLPYMLMLRDAFEQEGIPTCTVNLPAPLLSKHVLAILRYPLQSPADMVRAARLGDTGQVLQLLHDLYIDAPSNMSVECLLEQWKLLAEQDAEWQSVANQDGWRNAVLEMTQLPQYQQACDGDSPDEPTVEAALSAMVSKMEYTCIAKQMVAQYCGTSVFSFQPEDFTTLADPGTIDNAMRTAAVVARPWFGQHQRIKFADGHAARKAIRDLLKAGTQRHSLCGQLEDGFAAEGAVICPAFASIHTLSWLELAAQQQSGYLDRRYDVRSFGQFYKRERVPLWAFEALRESLEALGVMVSS